MTPRLKSSVLGLLFATICVSNAVADTFKVSGAGFITVAQQRGYVIKKMWYDSNRNRWVVNSNRCGGQLDKVYMSLSGKCIFDFFVPTRQLANGWRFSSSRFQSTSNVQFLIQPSRNSRNFHFRIQVTGPSTSMSRQKYSRLTEINLEGPSGGNWTHALTPQ